MKIKSLTQEFTVCKLEHPINIDSLKGIYFIGQTDEETSLVCETKFAPSDTLQREDDWRGFRIEGTLDFSLVGILAKISAILAANNIGIFAVSTYNTDYILTKAENFPRAIAALRDAGYETE